MRFLSALMVNVEVPVWYQLSTTSGSRPGIGNAIMNDFTPRAQQVLALARKEAERFNHNYVGTEHLLLGLIKLGQGVAVNVLQKMGLDLERVRMEVERKCCKDLILPKNPGLARKPSFLSATKSTTGFSAKS